MNNRAHASGLHPVMIGLLLLMGTGWLAGDSGNINVKICSGPGGTVTVTPVNPTVNIANLEYVTIHIQAETCQGAKGVPDATPKAVHTRDGASASTATAVPEEMKAGMWCTRLSAIPMVANRWGGPDPASWGNDVMLRFWSSESRKGDCAPSDLQRGRPDLRPVSRDSYETEKDQGRKNSLGKDLAYNDQRLEELKSCIQKTERTAAFLDDTETGWDIYGAQEAIGLVIVAETGSSLEKRFPETYFVPIQVVDKDWVLSWAAGLAFLGNRDQRYRLEPIEGDTKNLKLIKLKDEGIPYTLAAFAHYTPLSVPALNLTAGLGTNVPVTGLSAFLGLTAGVRPLPLTDSGFITLGVAYSQHKVLSSDFEGRSTVPVGTTSASLLQSRYDVSWFVGLSFSFLGGQEQFKAVYSGKAPDSTKAGGASPK